MNDTNCINCTEQDIDNKVSRTQSSLYLLGATKDNTNRDVIIYADDERMYAVYNEDTPDEYVTSINIHDILDDPDNYLYTPYIEFANLL